MYAPFRNGFSLYACLFRLVSVTDVQAGRVGPSTAQAKQTNIIFMWKEEEGKLKRSFTFKDFRQAMAFMQQVALVAEELDHHPWWSNVYNKVTMELTSHDAGNTVTARDHRLARRIDEILKEFES